MALQTACQLMQYMPRNCLKEFQQFRSANLSVYGSLRLRWSSKKNYSLSCINAIVGWDREEPTMDF
jgi:hypothetical protein